ncbi:MAG: diguanylate cyclase, partial [Oscillospiraceae bacterium]
LFTDPDTGEVRGHSYIENINKKKLEQLELIYKSEHDLLTGFYNKIATEKYITDFLSTGEGKIGTHAFLIIDVDYFKSVNDNFGHAFGDAVLSQFSAKIRDLFRDVDILGRIGGDEFVVFMKNVQSERVVLTKAREICSQVNDSFNKNGTIHKISASIGIAFYNEHGKTYQELYKNSDAALYISKQEGRDQYTVYNDNMCVLVSNIKAIDPHEFIEPKSFEKNIIEYIFRILYESNDKCLAINSVLELVGKHFNCDRTYIFENSPDSLYMSSTFEWCSDGIASQRLHSQSIPPELLKKSKNTFNQNGMFFLPDVAKSFIDPSEVFIPSDVKSLLQFSIDKNNEFRGFIGFDQCKSIRIPTKKEMSDLQSISNILGVFIMEMRAIEETVASKNMALSIINNLYSYAYVCDPANYKILFMNQKILEISPNAKIHDHCYSTIWQRKTPCEFCPIKSMINNRGDDFTMKLFNPLVNSWVKSTASWIDWLDGTKMCLVSISPISNQNK